MYLTTSSTLINEVTTLVMHKILIPTCNILCFFYTQIWKKNLVSWAYFNMLYQLLGSGRLLFGHPVFISNSGMSTYQLMGLFLVNGQICGHWPFRMPPNSAQQLLSNRNVSLTQKQSD